MSLIEEVGRGGAPGAVPTLLSYLCSGPRRLSEAAAQAIDQTVRACDDLQLARIDAAVRRVSEWQWPEMRPQHVADLAEGHTGTLGVLACHRSGHVREAAVRALSQCQDGLELAFLLIRLNDWVPQVRREAKAAVLERIRPDYAAHFVRHLPLVFRLKAQGRENHRDVLDAVIGLLSNESSRSELRAGLDLPDRRARRLALALLLDVTEGLDELLDQALNSADPVIRLRAAQAARRRLEGPALEQMLGRLQQDRFMPVRREAVYGYVERLPAAAGAALRASLFDPHPSVREAARSFLRTAGEADVAQAYRANLPNAARDQLAATIAGLGETGGREDVDRIRAFLNDADPRVRRAAVRALARLDADGHAEEFLAALDDPSPRVAKAAREVLRARRFLVRPDRWRSILLTSRQPHARRSVVSIVAGLNWWDAAPLLITAAASPDEPVRQAALAALTRWSCDSHRLAARPSREQLRALEQALERQGASLSEGLLKDAQSHIAYARRELT